MRNINQRETIISLSCKGACLKCLMISDEFSMQKIFCTFGRLSNSLVHHLTRLYARELTAICRIDKAPLWILGEHYHF